MSVAAPPSLDAEPTARAGVAATTQHSATPRVGDDLREIIEAYHGVTERLQQSHEALQREVLRLREQLASADAQLQRSQRLAALGQMAAGIAHEIRNPLAAISLYAEMIAEDSARLGRSTVDESDLLATQVHDNAGKITDAVRGLSGIVNDVLHFSRPIEPRRQNAPVVALFERVLQEHRPAIEQAGVTVELRCEPTLSAALDADLLHQALLNLVRNAVDAMTGRHDIDTDETRSDQEHRLSLTAERDAGNTLNLTVADTGPGIGDDAIDRIFNPFFTTRSTGTGLGLAIVHRIADAHGGSIAVRNDAHTGGAVFTLGLPQPSSSAEPSEESV